jgi:ABC-type bacteriocin/lantibiotic exporter with double-glycine peptidase domain
LIGTHNTREKSVLIGNLSQDYTLVPGRSVRDNIELYHSSGGGLSADTVVDKLGIREVLFDNKPEGLETILPGINQKGTNFSGGQRQLIALAQAVASEPGLLVLDEPLSALGPSMQAHINTVLLNLEKRPTIFFVTHKYEQANSCDWVLVIEKGEIVEQGPPLELLNKRKGIYKSLYRQQRKLVAKRSSASKPLPPQAPETEGEISLQE